jgi:hypothetical protein
VVSIKVFDSLKTNQALFLPTHLSNLLASSLNTKEKPLDTFQSPITSTKIPDLHPQQPSLPKPTMNATIPLHSILTTGFKLPYPASTAQYFAWSNQMKGLLILAGARSAIDPHQPVVDTTIDFDSPMPALRPNVVLAQCMIYESIAPGWKTDERWLRRERRLYNNPCQLWLFLEGNYQSSDGH